MLTYRYRCTCDADCDRLQIIHSHGHDLSCREYNRRERARFEREYEEQVTGPGRQREAAT